MAERIAHNQSIAAHVAGAYVRRVTAGHSWLEDFRIVAASLVSVWCLARALAPEAAASHGAVVVSTASAWMAHWLVLVPAPCFYAAAAGAAGLVMAGLHTRAAALLLALLLAINPHVLDPWHAAEAPAVAFVAFWLVLLPLGRSAPVGTGLTLQLLTVQLVLLYADPNASSTSYTALGVRPASLLAAVIPAALFVLPGGSLRAIPVAAQLAFHCYTASLTGHYLANALIASSGVVLLLHSTPTPDTLDAPPTSQRLTILDAPSAFALAWTTLLVVRLVAPMLHLSGPYEIATTALHDLGWPGRLHGTP